MNVLERVCLNLYNTSVEQGKNIAQLSEEFKKTHEIHEREMSDIRASQKETDERFNAVILMAEKFFSGENGDSKKKK